MVQHAQDVENIQFFLVVFDVWEGVQEKSDMATHIKYIHYGEEADPVCKISN